MALEKSLCSLLYACISLTGTAIAQGPVESDSALAMPDSIQVIIGTALAKVIGAAPREAPVCLRIQKDRVRYTVDPDLDWGLLGRVLAAPGTCPKTYASWLANSPPPPEGHIDPYRVTVAYPVYLELGDTVLSIEAWHGLQGTRYLCTVSYGPALHPFGKCFKVATIEA